MLLLYKVAGDEKFLKRRQNIFKVHDRSPVSEINMKALMIIKIVEYLAPATALVCFISSVMMHNYLRKRNINIPFSGVHFLAEIFEYIDETKKENGMVGMALKVFIFSFALTFILILTGIIASLSKGGSA